MESYCRGLSKCERILKANGFLPINPSGNQRLGKENEREKKNIYIYIYIYIYILVFKFWGF
jgi:hypothetical protein